MRHTRSLVTTSWDDGHPLDLRLAELLHKYELPATFYVPLANERPVLTKAQIRELSDRFEIGAHTLTHCDLTSVSDDQAEREIRESKHALEQIIGRRCNAFCFPKGRFNRIHLTQACDSGFCVVRTVELFSISRPRIWHGLSVLPTSLQTIPLRPMPIVRNSAKRLRLGNLVRFLRYKTDDWVATAESLIDYVADKGGVFHLWGHSWEIEEMGEWRNVERVFAYLYSHLYSHRSRTVGVMNCDVA